MYVLSGFLIQLLFAICSNAPIEEQENYHSSIEDDAELAAGFLEGDMLLDSQRNGLRNENYRWPNNTVHYYINHNHFDEAHINYILMAMNTIESISCIRFKEVTADQQYYMNITGLPNSCASNVGFMNTVQYFNLQAHPLGTRCFRLGTIIHELLHTLGFYHMHNTPNRDDYIQIITANIKEAHLKSFHKYPTKILNDFEEEYDYESIMHYRPYAFSVNGEKTIIPLHPEKAVNMGQRKGMTESDIIKLNLMYNCSMEMV